jgi:hypothetical protein
MLITVVFALGFFVVQEFWDGMPPRFVVKGIPARFNRLRPGMTWEQTRDILGLETSWLRGGTNASFEHGEGNGHYMHEVYNVRSPRIVMEIASVGGGPFQPTGFYRSKAMIQVWFRTDIDSGITNWRTNKATRLVRATFSNDATVVAEMPASR